MSVLVDTNVLLRSIEPRHPMQQVAVDSVQLLRQRGELIVLVPQNVYELWAVATRPLAQNGLGLTPPEAQAEVARFKSLFPVLDDLATIFSTWEQLVVQYQAIGKSAHDARLVAAMLVHGIDQLLTFNKADFARYQPIVVLSPQDVVGPAPTP
jgi:predicted nucleic acid-binding protein